MPPTDTNVVEDVRKTVRKLRAELEGYDHRRARQAGWTRRFIPTGLAPLDAVLPHGGLPCGAVVEILSEAPGVGAMSLAMRIASQFHQVDHPSCADTPYPEPQALACANSPRVEESQTLDNSRGLKPAAQGTEWGNDSRFQIESPISEEMGHPSGVGRPRAGAWGSDKHCVLLDTFEDFYPPAAWQYGIALDRLVVLRTRNARDAFWAVDQSLRCCSVAAVIAPFTRLDERHSRRLQLAAQSSGCIGLILKPTKQRAKSFAAVQMLLEGLPESPIAPPLSHVHTADSYLCRITLLAVRDGTPAEPVWVDLHHEAGISYPHPVPVDRSAAKIA